MKIKTIKKTLRAKFDEFLDTITDEKVKALVAQNTIITGGCIASMLLREDVNDFDCYFRNKETASAVAKYYVSQFNEDNKHREDKKSQRKGFVDKDDEIRSMLKAKGLEADASGKITAKKKSAFDDDDIDGDASPSTEEVDVPISVHDDGDRVRIVVKSAGAVSAGEGSYHFFEGDPDGDDASKYIDATFKGNEFQKRKPGTYAPLLLTDNAITLSDDVQLVLRFYGDPATIHEFYDFVHCTNYWTSWDDEVITNKAALESLLARELRYVGSQYPICSIIRTRKFIKRGWTINAGQIFKMCLQVTAMVTDQPDGVKWYDPGANNLLLDNIPLMQEQLVGVDQAYFNEIIQAIKNPQKGPDGTVKDVDQTYLYQLIDEVF